MAEVERDYEAEGYIAGQSGDPLDACKLRIASRRNAWVRGWHRGHEVATSARGGATISPENRLRFEVLRSVLRN